IRMIEEMIDQVDGNLGLVEAVSFFFAAAGGGGGIVRVEGEQKQNLEIAPFLVWGRVARVKMPMRQRPGTARPESSEPRGVGRRGGGGGGSGGAPRRWRRNALPPFSSAASRSVLPAACGPETSRGN